MTAEWDHWPKYFLYLSPPKVNSLFAQIERKDLKSIVRSLKIDLEVVAVELASPTAPNTIFSRLKVVLKHLDKQQMIGDAEGKAPYFAGAMAMNWGPLGRYGYTLRSDEDTKVAFFSSRLDRDKPSAPIVGLGGSVEHMTMGASEETVAFSSGLPALAGELARLERGEAQQMEPASLLQGVEHMYNWSSGPVSNVEFVAKRLATGPSSLVARGLTVTLGSPIYVAQSD